MKKNLLTTALALLTALCAVGQMPDFTKGGYPVDNQTTTVPAVKLNSEAVVHIGAVKKAEWIGDVLKVVFSIKTSPDFSSDVIISMEQWQIPEGGNKWTPKYMVDGAGNPNPLYQTAIGQSVNFAAANKNNALVSMEVLCDKDAHVGIEAQGVNRTFSNKNDLIYSLEGNYRASATADDDEWTTLSYSFNNDPSASVSVEYEKVMFDDYVKNWYDNIPYPNIGVPVSVPVCDTAIVGLRIKLDYGFVSPEQIQKTIYIRNIQIGAGYDKNGNYVGAYDFGDKSSVTATTTEGCKLKFAINEDGTTVTCTGMFNESDAGSANLAIPSTVTYNGTVYSVTCIDESAFDGTALTSVTIPSSVTSIGEEAFNNCNGLTEVTNYATVPQNIGGVFSGEDDITLYVAEASIEAYKAAVVWEDFKSIEAVEVKELADAVTTKKLAINALNTYMQADYRPAEWAAIEKIFADAKAELEALTTKAEVEDFDISGLKAKANAIKTDAELTEEEATSLEDVANAKPFTQIGNVLQFAEPTQVTIYSTSGAMLYNGVVSKYQLQTAGAYVVATANGSYTVIN